MTVARQFLVTIPQFDLSTQDDCADALRSLLIEVLRDDDGDGSDPEVIVEAVPAGQPMTYDPEQTPEENRRDYFAIALVKLCKEWGIAPVGSHPDHPVVFVPFDGSAEDEIYEAEWVPETLPDEKPTSVAEMIDRTPTGEMIFVSCGNGICWRWTKGNPIPDEVQRVLDEERATTGGTDA